MEILLLIIAGVVLYMLYNSFTDYMKNPYKIQQQEEVEYKPSDNPYTEITNEDKIRKNEFGILTQILAHIAKSDGKVCKLEKELLNDILDNLANELQDFKNARESLDIIFNEAVKNSNLDELANAFAEATKGEYKKRVKVIEFLFALAYADGSLDEVEREKIIDVAAIFELNNDDFNRIYDEFENKYNQNLKITKSNALKLLDLNKNFTPQELENAYHQKIKDKNQNIFKNLNKSYDSDAVREIDEAYRVLKDSIESQDFTQKAQDSSDFTQDSTPLQKSQDSTLLEESPQNFTLDSNQDSTQKHQKRL